MKPINAFFNKTLFFIALCLFPGLILRGKNITITEILQPNGTLNLAKGIEGSIDFTGYTLSINKQAGIQATPNAVPDGQWYPVGAQNFSSSLLALAIDRYGDLYAGGGFGRTTTPGVCNCNHIAKWDGTSWTELGGGIEGTVTALLIRNDILYVGGDFHHVNGIYARDFATYDLSRNEWNTSMPTPLGFSVRSIAIDSDGIVYINSGASSGNRLAFWNGSSWTTFGTDLSSGSVSTLAVDQNTNALYVGGGFTTAGGLTVNRIARWQNGVWSALGTGVDGSGTATRVRSIVINENNGLIYAAGEFLSAGGQPANRVAVWNGANWAALGTGLASVPNDLKLNSAGILYACGRNLLGSNVADAYIVIWDGTTWYPLGTGASDSGTSILGLLIPPNDEVYAFVQGAPIFGGSNVGVWANPCRAPHLSEITATQINETTVRLLCAMKIGIAAYDWRYRIQGTTSWTDVPSTLSNYVDLTTLERGRVYEFQASVNCAELGTWQDWSAAITFLTACLPPTLSQISATDLTGTAAQLNCTKSVFRCDFQYSRNMSTLNWTSLTAPPAGQTYFDLTGLNRRSEGYVFRARVQCSSGGTWSDYSSQEAFNLVCARPSTAEMSTTNITKTTATLDFDPSATTSNITRYRFEWKRSSSSTWSSTETTVSYANISGLSAGTTYNYRVRLYCSGAWGNFSDSKNFLTDRDLVFSGGFTAAPNDAELNSLVLKPALEIAPNPSHGQFNVKIQLPKAQTSIIRLVDVSGKLHYTQALDTAKEIFQPIQLEALLPGIYFLMLYTEDGVLSQKLMIE